MFIYSDINALANAQKYIYDHAYVYDFRMWQYYINALTSAFYFYLIVYIV